MTWLEVHTGKGRRSVNGVASPTNGISPARPSARAGTGTSLRFRSVCLMRIESVDCSAWLDIGLFCIRQALFL